MRTFFRRANPLVGWRDLRDQLGRRHPYRWRFMALSAAATYCVFAIMFAQEEQGLPRPPEIVYIESWRADRTDAEIIASNIAATEARKQREAAQAASQERVREVYKALGRVSGMDVDKIEREARAQQEAEAAAEAKAQEALQPRVERIN